MKIVIVGPAYPLRGGIAHYTALLYQHLARRHAVDVVTFSRQYPGILFPGKSQEERPSSGVAIPTERLIDSMNPFTWFSAARAISRRKPDLVIIKYWLPALSPCLGTIAALVRRWSNASIAFVCHNVLPHERRPGDFILTRYAFRHADFFIALSHVVARDVAKVRPGASMAVVPHPVYESFGKGLRKSSARRKLRINEPHILLFFGYVRQYKGLRTLLSALPHVLEKVKVHLYVAGEFYEGEESYRRQVDELNLRERVTIVPEYIPRDEVATYFSACDAVVLPYWSATQSGIVQIANHFDKPVIATDVGGISEVIRDGETGLLVPPRDEARLAEAIIRFYRRKMEQRLSKNVKKEKAVYSWDAMVRTIENRMQRGDFSGIRPQSNVRRRGK